MAQQMILVDTSILIDYYRKTDKSKTVWLGLVEEGYDFAISAITKYEIYCGAIESQIVFWDSVLANMAVMPFDESCVDKAVAINDELKRKRKQLDMADLFIAATAACHNLPLATLNKKHFERIDELKMVI
jgi:tRNA(fMet)-specific endonuclease VapC